MTLTPELLAELKKMAEAAKAYRWGDYYPGQAPKELVDLSNAADGATVLALLDRIQALERVEELETVRADPQSDALRRRPDQEPR